MATKSRHTKHAYKIATHNPEGFASALVCAKCHRPITNKRRTRTNPATNQLVHGPCLYLPKGGDL